jgi:hypothetical protein
LHQDGQNPLTRRDIRAAESRREAPGNRLLKSGGIA